MIDERVLYLFGFVSASMPCTNDDVFLVTADGVAVAASLVRAGDYERPPDGSSASAQLDWFTPLAWRHHEVLRGLHASGTVVPLKFGALCPDADHARGMLERLREPIQALLDRFEGKDEWSLKVRADRDAMMIRLRRGRADLEALEQQACELTAGASYFARKRLQRATADLLVDELAALHAGVCARLSHARLPLAPSNSAGVRPDNSAVIVADGALLVDRVGFAGLEETLAQLEREYAPVRLTCELTGPWPPYSFADAIAAV